MSLAKNTMLNLAGSALPIVISLVSVPLYLRFIGLERYGVIALCWLLLGYLGLFDFGLGRAVAQRIAAMREASSRARSSVFWLGLFASLGLGLIAAVVSFPLLTVALDRMKFGTGSVQAEVHHAIPLLALTLPFTLISGVFTGALLGRSRFGTVSMVDILTSSMSAVLPLLVAIFVGPQLNGLIAATLVGRLVSMGILAVACVKGLPLHRPQMAPSGTLKSLLSYGGWVSATNVVGPILSFVDRFVIGGLINASAVSIYSIPFNLVMRLTVIPDALCRALFPRYAMASAEEAEELCRDGVSVISVLLTPMAVIMIGAISPFLHFWVGTQVAGPASQVALLLIPGYWLNCFALIAYNQLHAQGRPDIPAKLHLAEVVPFIILLYVTVRWFGLLGAAGTWTLRTSLDALLMFRFSVAGLRALRRLILPFCLLWGWALTLLTVDLPLMLDAVATAVLTVIVLVIVFKSAPASAKVMVFRLTDRIHRFWPARLIQKQPIG